MPNEVKCEKHTQEITEIRTEFHEYKNTTNKRLDEIIEKLKPQFSHAQITTFLIILITTMASVMIYIGDIKSDTRNNTTELENLKENILTSLERIEKDVNILKSK